VDRKEAIQRVKNFLAKGTRPHAIIAANPEKNFSVPKDAVLYDTFKNADLLLPDGIGVVLAARILYGVDLERVPGSEFIFDICNIAADGSYKVFIYGATEDVNKKVVDELKNRYPDLKIVGRANGYVKESGMLDLIGRINASKAEILFLALGSPKQEWIRLPGMLRERRRYGANFSWSGYTGLLWNPKESSGRRCCQYLPQ